jgi:hypothetical protein
MLRRSFWSGSGSGSCSVQTEIVRIIDLRRKEISPPVSLQYEFGVF